MAYQVANYPAVLRYKTPKSYWQAMRLGLYQTVLDCTPIFCTKKTAMVQLIAQLKRFELDESHAKTQITQFLTNISYQKYHKEFIREVFYLYPAIISEIFSTHSHFLNDGYYQGLYFSYLSSLNKPINHHSFFDNLNNDDKRLLYSNVYLKTPKQKLENLNQIFSNHQLSTMALLNDESSFFINNLTNQHNDKIVQDNKVSILVTAYNSDKTLANCLNSLIAQTYANIEIIVINDNSTDNAKSIINDFIKKDSRIIGIDLPKNTGTYVAKNIGASIATGEFLTCQDSDDIAHAQKIECQVLPLLTDPNLIATTSYWCRLDDNGQFYVRQYYPFLRQNPASPLFRRQKVQNEIGLWHNVRTGSDSEFWARLKLHYGDDKIMVIKKPLTIASYRHESLMNSQEFGIHHKDGALSRLDYWESWSLWHIECLANKLPLKMPTVDEQLHKKLFTVPSFLVASVDDVRYNLKNYQTL